MTTDWAGREGYLRYRGQSFCTFGDTAHMIEISHGVSPHHAILVHCQLHTSTHKVHRNLKEQWYV